MRIKLEETERERLSIQALLDSEKTQAERNRLGQFATPTELAVSVLEHGLSLMPEKAGIKFLDPAIGTGSFYSALRSTSTGKKIRFAKGFEIDPHYGIPAAKLWSNTPLDITHEDFTKSNLPENEKSKANLLICNPPYVRHHHLDNAEKKRLQGLVSKSLDIKFSGLSGLYCYFMAIAHGWLAENAVSGWLIPSEFMDVNYGRELKKYLLHNVELLQIHRFDPNDVQFDDALVSSAVVWFRNSVPKKKHKVNFTYGGDLKKPKVSMKVSIEDLINTDKWTRFPNSKPRAKHTGWCLGDIFSIKRGLATGDNKFFILDEENVKKLKLPKKFLQPVLPSSRYLKSDEILSDENGIPLVDKRLFLINCKLAEHDIQSSYPALWDYLSTGLESVAPRYLCRNRRAWYFQENRPASPILCTYIGRSDSDKKPFRFLLNQSNATATNVFLMLYPKPLIANSLASDPNLMRMIWQYLNTIDSETLLSYGRVYGGGMHKLEPKELANIPVDEISTVIGLTAKKTYRQVDFIEDSVVA